LALSNILHGGKRLGYSIFGIAVDRNLTLKWLFPYRGPHGQVFVRGVEVKATFIALKRTTFIPKML
jgi:hypothetical protein